jgi:DNA replication protein DnaC
MLIQNSQSVNRGLIGYYKRLPTDRAAATKECSECGVLLPNEHLVDGVTYYQPVKCVCEIKAKEREQAEADRKEYLETMSVSTYSWLGSRWTDTALRQKTFENFDASRQTEAFEMSKAYAENPQGSLVLYGTFGTGKTHLLAAICNESLLKHGRRSFFCTSAKMFGSMQQRIHDDRDYNNLIEHAIKIPLLVIDDIDKAKWTEWREEVYFSIIDGRVNAGRPTAITTNRMEDLDSYVGGAVCSRLKIGQIAIEMVGKDYREEL